MELCRLCRLQSFNCSWNQLTGLPSWLRHVTTLTKLDARKNPIIGPLRFAAESENSARAVRHFLTELEHGAGSFRSVKLMLVGHGFAGKTTLKDVLQCSNTADIPAVIDRKRERTRGIETLTLIANAGDGPWVDAQTAAAMADALRFNVWDFGGQMEYCTGNQHFVSEECAVYVLVLNPCDKTVSVDQQARFWLSFLASKFDPVRLRHRAGLASIAIVITHGDSLLDTANARKPCLQQVRAVCNEEHFRNLPIVNAVATFLDLKRHPQQIVSLRSSLASLGRQQIAF